MSFRVVECEVDGGTILARRIVASSALRADTLVTGTRLNSSLTAAVIAMLVPLHRSSPTPYVPADRSLLRHHCCVTADAIAALSRTGSCRSGLSSIASLDTTRRAPIVRT